jgi:hypothetical protein
MRSVFQKSLKPKAKAGLFDKSPALKKTLSSFMEKFVMV